MRKALMIIGKWTIGILIVTIFSILEYKTKNTSLYFIYGYICGVIIVRLFDYLDKKIEEE